MLLLEWRAGGAKGPQQLLKGCLGNVSTSGTQPWNTSSSRDWAPWDSTTTLLLLLLLCHIHQGSVALALLVLLLLLHLLLLLLLLCCCHHGWMAHLVQHGVPLLRRHRLACPLLLLLLRVLKWHIHPLLLKLHLRGEWTLGQVTLLRGLLHGPTSTNHHPCRSTLWLIYVGSSSCHCSLGLGRHPLGSSHPSWP